MHLCVVSALSTRQCGLMLQELNKQSSFLFQLILAEVTHRLSPFIQHLTIQIFKDDWSRPMISYGAALSGHSLTNASDQTVLNLYPLGSEQFQKFSLKSPV